MAERDPVVARLQALAAGFREHACAELRRMRQQLEAPADVEAALAELTALLHRLAGSGSTFGFEALGRRARALEQALLTSEHGPRAVSLATVRAELAAAEAELRDHVLPRADPTLSAVKRAGKPGGSVAGPGRRRR